MAILDAGCGEGIGLLSQRQLEILKREDARIFFPMDAERAKTIQGTIGHNRRPILSLAPETGLRLVIGLLQDAIPDLIRFDVLQSTA